jgi:ribosomal subunit interface protein
MKTKMSYRCQIIICLTLMAAYATEAFLPTATLQRRPFISSLASTSEAGTAPITVTGNNIVLTPALESYVTNKIEKVLSKHSSSRLVNEIACTVHLSVSKNPKVADGHTAEVVTVLKGATVRVAESSPDMYSSVDLVADRLSRKLQKYKKRKMNGYHGKRAHTITLYCQRTNEFFS